MLQFPRGLSFNFCFDGRLLFSSNGETLGKVIDWRMFGYCLGKCYVKWK